jgi:hypothetical protein
MKNLMAFVLLLWVLASVAMVLTTLTYRRPLPHKPINILKTGV